MPSSRHSRRRRPKVDLSTVNADTELALVDNLAPEERRASTSGRYSPTLFLVAILSSIGVLAYTCFILNPAFRGDLIPWLIVISCELILIFQAAMALWTMLSGYGRQPSYSFQAAQAKMFDPQLNARLRISNDPTKWPMYLNGRQANVDVLITVYGESLDVIRTTVKAAMAMRGLHTTWILDDGDSDEVRDLAKTLGCRYVRRLGSSGAKAGNVNNALSVAKAEFFVIFDADFVAKPDFLYETLPFMEDPNVAFVQTPQVYGNLNNIVSRGAGFIQMVFYRFIQPGRNEFNAAFCVGTNVLFRRAAVKDIGGIYTQSKSEDIWTSILLHERGWRSIFQPKELAIGETPDTRPRRFRPAARTSPRPAPARDGRRGRLARRPRSTGPAGRDGSPVRPPRHEDHGDAEPDQRGPRPEWGLEGLEQLPRRDVGADAHPGPDDRRHRQPEHLTRPRDEPPGHGRGDEGDPCDGAAGRHHERDQQRGDAEGQQSPAARPHPQGGGLLVAEGQHPQRRQHRDRGGAADDQGDDQRQGDIGRDLGERAHEVFEDD